MATSPLFGWVEPDDTSLVKDGAAAIRTLGNSIDASMGDLLGGTTGQILAKQSNTNMDFQWVSPNPGDITAVTAGTGISGGGTSGDVTITNSMATTITTKGDLIVGTGSATFNRLAAAENGSTLVADSSTSTGLRYQGSIAGGKNFVINGGMDIWQRGTSFAVGGVGANFYSVDRWTCYSQGAGTIAQDTSLSASGFRYGVKFTSSSASGGNDFYQLIETDQVIPLAGKQVALSGYALSVNGKTPAMNLEYSTTVNDGLFGTYVQCTKTTISEPTATGSLLRYTYSFAVPTTAKTLRLRASTGSLNNTEATIWTGVQLELGNVPTAFSRAGGTIQGELAACQRYYQVITAGGTTGINSTTQVALSAVFPPMRTSSITFALTGALRITDVYTADYTQSSANITTNVNNGINGAVLSFGNFSGLTAYRNYSITSFNQITASAEL